MDYPASQVPSGYAATQVNLDRRPSDTASRVSSRVSDWVDNNSGAVVPHHDAGTVVSRKTNPNPNPLPPANDDDDAPRIIRRTVTTTTTTTWERKPSTSSDDAGGVAGAVAGLLGAAVGMGVGAALTYGSTRGDEPARASPPEPISRLLQPMSTARGLASERGDWVEVDRAAELPQYLANYGHGSVVPSAARSTASARPRTVVSAAQGPLLLTAAEARSQAGSRYSRAPSNAPSNAPRGHTVVNGDGASHVSTRSRTTAKPPTQQAPSHAGTRHTSAPRDADAASRVSARTHKSAAPSRQAAPSRASSTASTMKAPTVIRTTSGPSNSGRKGSVVSARGVPLPRSSAGSSHASRWDDLESIAPSESISCADGPRSRMYC